MARSGHSVRLKLLMFFVSRKVVAGSAIGGIASGDMAKLGMLTIYCRFPKRGVMRRHCWRLPVSGATSGRRTGIQTGIRQKLSET